jgi:hypothetical protein
MADAQLDWSELPALSAHWEASADDESLLRQLGLEPEAAEACASEWYEVRAALNALIEAAATNLVVTAAAAWAYYNAVSTMDQTARSAGQIAVDEATLSQIYAEAQWIQQIADAA